MCQCMRVCVCVSYPSKTNSGVLVFKQKEKIDFVIIWRWELQQIGDGSCCSMQLIISPYLHCGWQYAIMRLYAPERSRGEIPAFGAHTYSSNLPLSFQEFTLFCAERQFTSCTSTILKFKVVSGHAFIIMLITSSTIQILSCNAYCLNINQGSFCRKRGFEGFRHV